MNTNVTQQSLQLARSLDQFEVLAEVGYGSFGSVFRAKHLATGKVALENLRSSPNIVKLHHYFLEKKELYMVFELMQGNLYQMMKDRNGLKLEEPQVRSMIFQVLQGLQHMHSKGIMHRDMKPENLLVSTCTLNDLIPSATHDALEIIQGLLKYDPKKRTTAYQALYGQWFQDMPGIQDLKLLTDVQRSPDKRR
ncbi:hypothetical protein BGZ83_001075, partial [Gryganskiella cystojenkinii]